MQAIIEQKDFVFLVVSSIMCNGQKRKVKKNRVMFIKTQTNPCT